MAEEVGVGYLSIIPSMRGFGAALQRDSAGPLNQFTRDAQGRLRDMHGRYVAEAGEIGQESGEELGQGFTSTLKGTLKAGLLAVGAAAGVALVVGVTEALEQANIKSTLQAQLGTTGPVAAEHGKLAGKLFATGVSGTFQEAADAIKSTVQSGLAPPDATNAQLEKIATKASDVATVFQQDLGGVTRAVSQMIRTGLAKNSDEAFDLITKGFQSGTDKAEDFLDTINEYGTQFRKAGLDGATSIGLLNQAIGAGARDADVAADAIKEFSIRAVDGSKTTVDGFKALGLNADEMAAKFGAGGKSAAGALDLTLDKLRGMKDPVDQSAAAVNLFGTQSEDLGKALFAMDPSSAAKKLGTFAGTTDKLGKTIRSGPAHELELFTRNLKQGFVEFLGGEVLPVISQFGHFLNAYVAPPLRVVGSILGAVLMPILTGLISVVGAVVGWVREFGVWLIPLGIAIGGVTLALNAQAIATAAVTAVFSIYRAAILVGTAVTNGFAAAQGLLNAVMALNPITLIVIGLVALGAALVIAWKRSETFRNIVMAAWNGIKTAALVVWNSVLKPALTGIWTALQVVGRAALWLWQNAIGPAFRFIWTAAKVLFAIVATVVLVPLIAVFKLVGFVATQLWKYAIQPAFKAIAAIVKWAWNTVVKPVFGLWMAVFRQVGAVVRWLYDSIVKPVFGRIKTVFTIWWAGTKVIFGAVVSFLRGTLGAVFRWLYDKVIRPVWNGIKVVIGNVWYRGIKPVFELLKRGVNAVRDGFKAGVSAIGKIWDRLKSVAKKPVQFVVDTVYNNGIRKVWNVVAGLVGLKKLNPVKFARGGSVFGAGTATSDSIPALLSNNEHVWTAKEVAGAGGHGAVEALRAQARSGGMTFAKGGPVPGYALGGGVIDWLSDKAKKIGSAVMSGVGFLANPGKMWDKATSFIREKIATLGTGNQWVQAISQFPVKMLKGLKDKVLSAANGLFGGGGKGVAKGLAFARSQAGKPYQWGGVGNPSWDCSGFLGGIQSAILGQNPRRRLWSTFAFSGSRAPSGWRRGLRAPYMIGITNRGVGHTAGTLGGVNVESRGGSGVVVGSRARSWRHPMFDSHYGFAPAIGGGTFDQGGFLQPGLNLAYNGTGRPEPVFTSRQADALMRLASVDRLTRSGVPTAAPAAGAAGARGGDTYIIQPRTLDMNVRDLEVLQRRQDARARVGRPR